MKENAGLLMCRSQDSGWVALSVALPRNRAHTSWRSLLMGSCHQETLQSWIWKPFSRPCKLITMQKPCWSLTHRLRMLSALSMHFLPLKNMYRFLLMQTYAGLHSCRLDALWPSIKWIQVPVYSAPSVHPVGRQSMSLTASYFPCCVY